MNQTLSTERWLLIDDHTMFADAMSLTLRHLAPQLEIDVAANAQQAIAQLKNGQTYQCILIDLDLPDTPGLALLDQILKRWPQSVVLICSANRQPSSVTNAQQLGARGFITKDQSPADILAFVQQIRQGRRWITTDTLTRELAERREENIDLTGRQHAILQQMQTGLSTSEIAQALNLSPNTIKTHTRLMYGKLGVSNRTECLNRAAELGLI
ncbi:response regulator transcription factor [Reinekea blandensis]|uniref:Response regulator containing a CheY-like receiver domain and an HTH DNA-binding domain n=1 Tax=Reinekea blandensis MED297 TaxID=314283 RepID=A4BB39_9GAMM|nr:response regulator transcription factor [Reinekea blandensis]EAR10652.1 Response regulator containing a CheY-like receiver domain and an HTH DNA-binding domain [Reinekea sp. MED297] [Reinekea blandensis MED297]